MIYKQLDGLLLDFDGVICQNSIGLTIDFIHEFTNQFIAIPHFFVESYVRSIACFPVEHTVKLFFSSIGLQYRIADFMEAYQDFDRSNQELEISPGVSQFIEYCLTRNIDFKIFSLANEERILQLSALERTHIYRLEDRSKADIQTYLEMGKKMNINLGNWVYLDDNPLALYIGKQAGLQTVMMQTHFFTPMQFDNFKEKIDYRVTNFHEFHTYIKSSFQV